MKLLDIKSYYESDFMTSKALAIIISGLPCTGKTTIARKLSQKYSLPLFSKDDVKESLFDSLGWEDRKWSKKIGMATYPILYHFIESQLKARKSFIVESNFHPKYDSEKFLVLKKKYSFDALIIQCQCEGTILLDRFVKRSNSGERHEGHLDHLNIEEFKDQLLLGELEILDIGAKVFELETSDYENIYTREIEQFLESHLNKSL
jgi:predicted kinase